MNSKVVKIIIGGAIPLIILIIVISSYHLRERDSCLKCHSNIEKISQNHDLSCVDCHSGNNRAKDKDTAHKDMIGGKNPSDISVVHNTCQKCHDYQVKRVKSTIMLTNKGLIEKTKLALGIKDNISYSLQEGKYYNKYGNPVDLKNISQDNSFGAELYRKFCASCHINDRLNIRDDIHRSSGCATCHMPYDKQGKYVGSDVQLKGKKGYSRVHKFEPLPTDAVCLSCHHRSGRIGLTYYGKFDGNDPKIPSLDKFAGRTLTHIKEDIHKELGLECIDCHTSREIMGDGFVYDYLYEQLEITCENCHGSYTEKPKTSILNRENLSPLIEGKNYKTGLKGGNNAVLTSKGNYFSNVFEENGNYYLIQKRSGKIHKLKIITGTNPHNIVGHERLECYSCHSRSVPQCYGCHTFYDKRFEGYDFVKKRKTDGAFYEKEGFRIAYPFPLGINQKGKISPITPGCQTNIYIIDSEGNYIIENYVPEINRKKIYKFAPIFSHNVGKKALRCEECHFNPFFAGFGFSLFSKDKKTLSSIVLCENSITKTLDSFTAIQNGILKRSSSILRNNARPFDKNEILKIFKVNICLVCHRSYDDKIYRKNLDYSINDSYHTKFLSQ